MCKKFYRKYSLPTKGKVYSFLTILEIKKTVSYILFIKFVHVMLLHFYIKLTSDITSQSFLQKEYLFLPLSIQEIPMFK